MSHPSQLQLPRPASHVRKGRAAAFAGELSLRRVFLEEGAELGDQCVSVLQLRQIPSRAAAKRLFDPQRSFPQPLFPFETIVAYPATTLGNILSFRRTRTASS